MGGGNGCGEAPPPPVRMRRRQPVHRTEALNPGRGFSLKQKADSKAGPAVQAGEDRLQPDPSPKNCGTSPRKRFFPAPRPETFGKPFFWRCGAALPPRAVPQKRDAFRRSFFAVPRRRCAIPRRCFLHRPIPKAQRSSRPRLSSEPLFLCSLPGARPAAQLLRLST